MIKSAKIAISLPKENLEKIERIRKKMGLGRSVVIDLAISYWINSLEEKELIRQYQEGYQKRPESVDETLAMEALAAEAFKEEGLK